MSLNPAPRLSDVSREDVLGPSHQFTTSIFRHAHATRSELEVVLDRQLDFAIVQSRGRDGSIVSVSDRRIGQAEERMVQGIENFGSKLRVLRFPDRKILIQREIEIVRIWTDQNAAAGISKDKLVRTIYPRIHKCGGVEPLMYAALSPGQVGFRQ